MSIAEHLAAVWREASDAPSIRAANARPIAIGWQTVELDRAASELADALGLGEPESAFVAAPRSVALGGSCRVARGVLPHGGSLVVLEPDTEGRLAGSLARLGEGPAVVWFESHDRPPAVEAFAAAGSAVLAERGGPFGLERLIAVGLPAGRHWLLVDRTAGTIRR